MALHDKKKKRSLPKVENDIVKKIAEIKAKSSAANSVSKTKLDEKSSKPKGKKKQSKDDTFNSASKASEETTEEVSDKAVNLMLKDVLDLGGTQEDFELLKGLSDGEEESLEINCAADDAFNMGELVTFMKSNGLKVGKKEKKKKPVSKDSEAADKPAVVKEAPISCPFAPSNPSVHEKLIFIANEPW